MVEDDQDVFHIISKKNGGADHTDNYHFVQNKHMNRAIGHKYDDLNCYLAGEAKAEKAVAISKQMCGYKGPSAVELYKQGEERFREMNINVK